MSKLELIMKQKTIKTDKTTLLVVELLPKINLETIKFIEGTMYYHDHIGRDGISVPEGNWQLLGRLPDITEEQSDKVVESEDFKHYSGEYFHMFVDYNNCENAFDDSLDSLHSLLQANDVCFENPLGSKPDDDDASFSKLYQSIAWEKAQTKVWDKERCYLFIKVD